MRIELALTDGEHVITKVIVQEDAMTADFHEVADAIVNNLNIDREATKPAEFTAEDAHHALTGE